MIQMDVMTALFTRRSIGVVKPMEPPKEVIMKCLEAAVHAPNHFRTEPWRFFVLTGQARERYGDVLAAIRKEELEAKGEAVDEEKLAKEKAKAFRAPVLITVAVVPDTSNPRVVELEEIMAGAAAVQNLLLAVHAHGLAAIWRTGEVHYHPKLKAFFNLPEEAHLIGTVYIGYPDISPPAAKRTPATDKTTWLTE
jgi:nitroreductase